MNDRMERRFKRQLSEGSQQVKDLNSLYIPVHAGPAEPLKDYSAVSTPVQVVFRDLETRLIQFLTNDTPHVAVVGCVAWLTSLPILEAMSHTQGCALVVQKEDFLRPDLAPGPLWRQELREAYGSLRELDRHQFPGLLGNMSVAWTPEIDPVRCLGNHNRDRKAACPRVHHKFVVLCRTGGWGLLEPYAVWTGSFNFTKNGTRSLENAVILHDPVIVQAYFDEFQQIAAISEPLDWESNWCEPEWRIGT